MKKDDLKIKNKDDFSEDVALIDENEKKDKEDEFIQEVADEEKSVDRKKLLFNKMKNIFSNKEFLFFLFLILYLEALFRFSYTKSINEGIIYSILFSIPMALFFSTVVNLLKGIAKKILFYIIAISLSFITCVQIVYTNIFETMMVVNSIFSGGIKQAWGFKDAMFDAMAESVFLIILAFAPIVIVLILRNSLFSVDLKLKEVPIYIVVILMLHLICIGTLFLSGESNNSSNKVYFKNFNMNIAAEKLGLFTAERLDLKFSIFGKPIALLETSNHERDYSDKEKYNIMEMNLEELIEKSDDEVLESINQYVLQEKPTMKNEYTGMFEGYNLIYICAEGFSEYVISEELTPTLYMMKNEGFNFSNYYNPIWDVSTSDGEYTYLTGLLPVSGIWTFSETGIRENNMYFTMGRQFERLGYTTKAYHNHTYSYYDRNYSHPNMGYHYQGVGNGLEVENVWPASDLEMFQNSVHEWINEENFHAYYLTISGHLNYTFGGNNQARANQDVVANLDYSESCKAYLACNYEVEKSMKYLIDELEKAGQLDNTLIVLSADHYPYGLVGDGNDYSLFNEFLGHEIDPEFELYRNEVIIWSASMEEPVNVDKYTSTVDLIPTVSNLLGLEYDSRLFAGRDVFGGSESLVIFKNRNWITEKCMYISDTNTVIPLVDSEIPQGYIDSVNKEVEQRFLISELIFKYDYYDILFGDR